MSKNFDAFPTDPDEMAVKMMEMGARHELDSFLGLFRKDFAAKIDFKKGYELLDKELPSYMPPERLNQRNTFTLFVKATRKTGQPIRFLVHTIWMGEAKFAVGISEVPDGAIGNISWN